MKTNRKGISIGINVIVIMAIALIALLVILGFFLGGFGTTGGAISGVAGEGVTTANSTDIAGGIQRAIGDWAGGGGGSGNGGATAEQYWCCIDEGDGQTFEDWNWVEYNVGAGQTHQTTNCGTCASHCAGLSGYSGGTDTTLPSSFATCAIWDRCECS